MTPPVYRGFSNRRDDKMHKTKTLYLVRHGQASAGTSDYDRLSERGIHQATLVGEHFRSEGIITPTAHWSGGMKRQRQTAGFAHPNAREADAIPVHEGLNEYDHHSVHTHFEPGYLDKRDENTDMTASMTIDEYHTIVQSWVNHEPFNDAPYTGERFSEFEQRCLDAVKDIGLATTHEHTALYTSGGVIAVVTAALSGMDYEALTKHIWTIKNASISTLTLTDGTLSVASVNDVTHLEKHNDPELITYI